MSEESSIADKGRAGSWAPSASSLGGSDPPDSEPEHWGRSISRNVAALTVARGVSTVLKLLLTAYLARTLGPGAFGILGFGIALLSYFMLVTRLGFDWVGTREVARDPRRVVELASTITSFQLMMSIAAFGLYTAIVLLLPKGALFKSVILIQGLALFADAASLEWAFQGVQRMGILAVRIVAISLLQLGAVLLLVHQSDDVALAAVAHVGSFFLLNAWLIFSFVRKFGPLHIRVDVPAWRTLMPAALPIAASALMAGVFYNLDQVMLGLMRSEAEVGLYSAGVRALIAALMPSMIIVQSYFPALSGAVGDIESMRERARAFAAAMIPIGIPLAAVGTLLARPLLVFIAGEKFAPGAGAFALLMANAGLIYVNMTFGYPLLAWNLEKAYMAVTGTGVVFGVLLNWLFIPQYGIVGAASSTLAAQCLLFLGLAAIHIRAVRQAYVSICIRTGFATLVGVVFPVLALKQIHAPLFISLVVAGLGYGACAWFLGLVRPTFLKEAFQRS